MVRQRKEWICLRVVSCVAPWRDVRRFTIWMLHYFARAHAVQAAQVPRFRPLVDAELRELRAVGLGYIGTMGRFPGF